MLYGVSHVKNLRFGKKVNIQFAALKVGFEDVQKNAPS